MRLGAMVVTILVAALLVSFFLTVIPGDAARLMVGPEATPERYEAARRALGLDQPWLVRFSQWFISALHGDLGQSWRYPGMKVTDLLAQKLSLTFPLAGFVALLSFLLGLSLGVLSLLWFGRAADLLLSGLCQLGLAIPEFWLGIILIIFFSVRTKVFPAGGFPGWGEEKALAHLILPALALSIPRAAYFSRLARAALADLIFQDFVRTARAKGLGERAVLIRHVLRNGLIPVVAGLGLTFARLLAGTLVVEQVFGLPGLGRLALEAAFGRDIPLILGLTTFTVAVAVAASTTAELVYGFLDPRIRRA